MPTTEHIHLPLYTDEETPDLSTTGHYNHAMEIIDANVGELESKDAELAEDIADERETRIEGESALEAKLAAETKARTDADKALDTDYKAAYSALDGRVDNAEEEISANSADLTGIKGLTYGEGSQVFLENENGSYSSPALEEIRNEISDLQAADWYEFLTSTDPSARKEHYDKMLAHWPKCYMHIVLTVDQGATVNVIAWPYRRKDSQLYLRAVVITTRSNAPGYLWAEIKIGPNEDGIINVNSRLSFTPMTTWETLTKKPFSTIGSGLKVVDNALTVDTAALLAIIKANTTSGVTA